MNNPKSILLVDPFADECDMYAEFLRFSGFEVAICTDPATALAAASERHVDAVVTRILQHGSIDGVAFTRQLKADERTRSIPVIIITTRIEANLREAATAAGCDRFLLLPCVPQQLAAELRRVTTPSAVAKTRHNSSDH